MKIKYERRKVVVPTCPVCKVTLMGNGSMATPYECECGVCGGVIG